MTPSRTSDSWPKALAFWLGCSVGGTVLLGAVEVVIWGWSVPDYMVPVSILWGGLIGVGSMFYAINRWLG